MSITELCELEQRYNVVFLPRSEMLNLFWNRYIDAEENSVREAEVLPEDTETDFEESEIKLDENVIIPNEGYVRGLLSDLSSIEGKLGKYEYSKFRDSMEEILQSDDFEDADEIMSEVHELVKKYIYGSDSKISISEWKYLEQYIERAGYKAVSIKSGDSVEPFRTYFDRPIPAEGGKKNTIKQIQLMPYTISFYDGEQVSELKLCGKCTYYRG